jgi:nucleoside-diphosphate-sugar epimerase
MNILITGSSGFLGKFVAREFLSHGHRVYGVSRSTYKDVYQTYSVDITDFYSLNSLVGEKSIDIIVHLAGKPIVSDCDKNPFDAYKVNSLGTASVLECARINNISRVISVETDKIYGVQKSIPTNENASYNPNSPYELSKVFAASLADFYRKVYGSNIISVRPANLYGPGDHSTSRIIPNAIRSLKDNIGIRLYENSLHMQRDFIYVEDVAKAIYKLATDYTNHYTYNLSTNSPISMLELADLILSVARKNIKHRVEPKISEYTEIPLQQIDGSRFSEEFKFTYTSLTDGLLSTWLNS